MPYFHPLEKARLSPEKPLTPVAERRHTIVEDGSPGSAARERDPRPEREADVGKRKLTIYSYSDDDDRPIKIQNSLDELTVSHVLEYDLAEINRKVLEKSKGKSGIFYVARLNLTLSLTAFGLTSTLSWHGNELAMGSEMW